MESHFYNCVPNFKILNFYPLVLLTSTGLLRIKFFDKPIILLLVLFETVPFIFKVY